LPLIAVLSACASSDDRYPSLAIRPFEVGVTTASPAPPPALSVPIRPAIDPARISALRDRANAAHAAFLASESAAQTLALAAAGRSAETNARAAALVAMADLSSRRGVTSAVLADLDLLTAEASTALVPDPALNSAQAEIAALVAREDAGMARLWEVMGS
jgi:hypothetical protein